MYPSTTRAATAATIRPVVVTISVLCFKLPREFGSLKLCVPVVQSFEHFRDGSFASDTERYYGNSKDFPVLR